MNCNEKGEISHVGEALEEDLKYEGDEGDSTSGSSIYISSFTKISSVVRAG